MDLDFFSWFFKYIYNFAKNPVIQKSINTRTLTENIFHESLCKAFLSGRKWLNLMELRYCLILGIKKGIGILAWFLFGLNPQQIPLESDS